MLAGLAAFPLGGCATTAVRSDEVAALEARSGGRLGVAILDTASGRFTGHRADERFGMCSTFKLPLAALVLAEIDAGRLNGDEIVRYAQADMVPHAPVTGKHLDTGLSILALAEAAQVTSDNPAANLLIRRLGGPEAITARLRAWGDPITRLDRYETAMNLVLPGEVHDTTSPRAMAMLAARILAGDVLSTASRARLVGWMVETNTGLKRIRAGLPAAWRAGDKTGTALHDAMNDKVNDVAIAFPPGRPALVVAAYYDGPARSQTLPTQAEAVLAEVGRIAAEWYA